MADVLGGWVRVRTWGDCSEKTSCGEGCGQIRDNFGDKFTGCVFLCVFCLCLPALFKERATQRQTRIFLIAKRKPKAYEGVAC